MSLVQCSFWGVSAQAVLCSVGLCPGDSLYRGLCPGVSLQGISARGSLSRVVCVQGDLCPGVPFRETSKTDPPLPYGEELEVYILL